MKIVNVYDFIFEVENITKFHEDKRWSEIVRRLGGTDPSEPGAKEMSALIEKKHLLKAVQDLRLLIEKAEKDVRD